MLLHIPILDHSTQVSQVFSLSIQPLKILHVDQQQFDPYNNDAGNGLLPDGSYAPTDPTRAYMPWNTTEPPTRGRAPGEP